MKNFKVLRQALCFGDMHARFFIGANTTIVVLQLKKSNIAGHIQWHIATDASFLTLQANVEDEQCITPSDKCLQGKFDIVQSTSMEPDTTKTWLDNEVSYYDFLYTKKVLKFIGNKSLAYKFNELMYNNFSAMLYRRPKTDPSLNFQPLTQYSSFYWLDRIKGEASCIFDLSDSCVAIWQLHGFRSNRIHIYHKYEFTKELKYTSNSRDLLMKSMMTNDFRGKGYDKKNIFKHLVNEDVIFPNVIYADDMRRIVYDMFNRQAELWFQMVTEIKTYERNTELRKSSTHT